MSRTHKLPYPERKRKGTGWRGSSRLRLNKFSRRFYNRRVRHDTKDAIRTGQYARMFKRWNGNRQVRI